MRCLYCGKELALLKRWTGGGEFCSDVHRQRYQEEYNQLALNRLLQAKPPAKPDKPAPEPAAKPLVESVKPTIAYSAPEPVSLRVSEAPVAEPAYREIPASVSAPAPAAVRPPVQERPAPSRPEVKAPAEAAGFFVEMPVALVAEVAPMFHSDMEFLDAAAAALPNHSFEPLNAQRDPYQLGTAGLLTFKLSNQASNYTSNGTRERRLEVRDFVRTTPVVEIELSPAGETGLETSSEAMDILMIPQPPKGLPPLWAEPHLRFSGGETELGDMARLTFSTTGFSGGEEPQSRKSEAHSAFAVAEPEAEIVVAEPVAELVAGEPVPEPAAEQEIVAQEAAEAEAVKPEVAQGAPVPEPVTKPLPLTLQATAPAKGKAVQVFSSAANAVNVHVPRSSSLPLRATMTFGPAPVRNDVKSDLKKPAPEPRVISGKPQPEIQDVKRFTGRPLIAEPPKQAQNAELPSPPRQAAKVDAKHDKKPEVKENVMLKEDIKPHRAAEPLMPAPLAAPYPGSSDLGLPRLNLESSPGFLGQIPMVARIGIVVVLVAGLGTLIAFSSKSGAASPVSGNPGTVVAGTALPSGEAGWITDWGADPGVRRTRQISILRSSQTLTDYRIELQGQIETKAIGWIFRAADPKNFYVTKLEIVKPGLEPTVALVRFAVINGEEGAHTQLPLPMKVRRDTMYKIRMDAVGNHFTTYVMDEKVDDWTDERVKTGGVGLYSERGEVATLKGGMAVVPLVIRK